MHVKVEVSILQLDDWGDGKDDGWIDQQRVSKLSKGDQMLVKSLKMIYIPGKGNRHVVPLLIPSDCVEAMEKIVHKDTRKNAGVAVGNDFIFPSTKHSELNMSGWHALKDICGNIDLQKSELINAANNRHRVSTLYAALDIPKEDREIFYKHMGHSSQINEDIYQTPLALAGITKVGKNLLKFSGESKVVFSFSVFGPSIK